MHPKSESDPYLNGELTKIKMVGTRIDEVFWSVERDLKKSNQNHA